MICGKRENRMTKAHRSVEGSRPFLLVRLCFPWELRRECAAENAACGPFRCPLPFFDAMYCEMACRFVQTSVRSFVEMFIDGSTFVMAFIIALP